MLPLAKAPDVANSCEARALSLPLTGPTRGAAPWRQIVGFKPANPLLHVDAPQPEPSVQAALAKQLIDSSVPQGLGPRTQTDGAPHTSQRQLHAAPHRSCHTPVVPFTGTNRHVCARQAVSVHHRQCARDLSRDPVRRVKARRGLHRVDRGCSKTGSHMSKMSQTVHTANLTALPCRFALLLAAPWAVGELGAMKLEALTPS